MRVLILGGAGQVGQDLVLALRKHEAWAPPRSEVDVRELDQLRSALKEFTPDWVVNCAALHDVDRCETEVGLAFAVNAVGAANVASVSAGVGARTLYVSTDYVFSGRGGAANREDDVPDPVNVYGRSKRAGEEATLAADRRGLVVRTSAVFGVHPCRGKVGSGANFVELMLRLARERGRLRVVDDEVVSPTYAGHLAPALVDAMQQDRAGIAHLAGEGGASWLEFARAIVTAADIAATVEPAAIGEFPKKAARPPHSALVATRGPSLPPWRQGLGDYLKARSGG